MNIEIKSRLTGDIIITGDFASLKEACEKNKANLYGANLSGADLHGAYLYGANLSEANLSLATGYLNSHNFFAEIVRRQATESFTSAEWVAIGQITLHRLCWDSIEKRFASDMHHIFEVLAQAGFSEWLNYWNKS